ncbi:transglycosylase domain-containing protein [Rubritalea halochordaticola]
MSRLRTAETFTMPAKKKTAKKAARKSNAKRVRKSSQRSLAFRVAFAPFLAIGKVTAKWPTIVRWPARIALGSLWIGFFIFCAVVIFYGARAHSSKYDPDKITQMPARSIVYAQDGVTEIGKLHGDNRLMVSIDEVSPWFKKALIAREDARFYDHGAIDIRSLGRAVFRNVTQKKMEGASTLTMQLVDNSYAYNGKSIDGKLLEMAIAFRIEANYKKDQILEHYMNRIFWGHSIRGIEAAARTYFEKPASELTLSESALLAGIIRGPNTFSPFVDLQKAIDQRDTTLKRMVHYKFITEAEAEDAKNEKVKIRPVSRRITHDSYAMDAIRRDLDIILEEQEIEMGGLHIKTTINPELQKAAELAIEARLKEAEKDPSYHHQTRAQYLSRYAKTQQAPKYIQGALVCLDNRTGAVLALVGGRNADESKYNRALHGKRQIGSVFKPFVYMTAFDKGLHPGAWVRDSRIQPGEIQGAPRSWSPNNSDGTYKTLMMVQEALARSRNTSSVRIGDYCGIDQVIETARSVGFTGKIPPSPATYLGTFEASPWEVAKAYTVFPNQGKVVRPFIISEIKDSEGNVVYPGSGTISWSAAKQGAATSVSNTLQEVTSRGTASRLRSALDYKEVCGGKTGTTDNYRDAWFAGYTSSLTCAVWVGMDDNTKTINRGYGSTLALPIWAKVMKKAKDLGYPAESLKPNIPMQSVRLCRFTSQLATQGCEAHHSAYNAAIPVDLIPKHTCDNHPVRAQIIQESAVPAPPSRAVPVQEGQRPSRAIPVR